MSAVPQALIAVGKDCDCGHPLVWRHNEQWCSVYGTHATRVHYRRYDAPLANVVSELCRAPLPAEMRKPRRKARVR